MKTIVPLLTLIGLLCGSVTIIGCAAMSGRTPPAKFETVIYDHQTNVVQKVITIPKEVWTTNTVTQVVTNEHNLIVTNVISQFVPKIQMVTVTNLITNYTTIPKPEVEADIQAAAGAANLIIPGLGTGLGAALIGLYRFWAQLRSSKAANKVFATNTASLLDFIETLPKGPENVELLKSWLQRNQEKIGAHATVVEILSKYVEHKDVKNGAEELKNLLRELQAAANKPS